MRLYKTQGALDRAIRSIEDDPSKDERIKHVLPALQRIRSVIGWGAEACRVCSEGYAPRIFKNPFFAEPPESTTWTEMHNAMTELNDLALQVPELKLMDAARWFSDWLLKDNSSLRLFPATSIGALNGKYRGRVVNMSLLKRHEADDHFRNDAHVYDVKSHQGKVAFWLIWNNQNEPEFHRNNDFRVYRALVEMELEKNYRVKDICSITPYRVVPLHNNDYISNAKLEQEALNEFFCRRVDAVLSKVMRPQPESKEILWSFDLNEVSALTSVPPRSETEEQFSYYCFRPDFTFDCDEVEHCCGECRLLKHVYKNLLPHLIDAESYARLKKFVGDSGLFSRKDDAGKYICFPECPKKNKCQHNVKVAVDEIYRAYFEAQHELYKERAKRASGK